MLTTCYGTDYITRKIATHIPSANPTTDAGDTITLPTLTGGTITVRRTTIATWDVIVRDRHGSPTPLAGIQAIYSYRQPENAARALVLAYYADAERANDCTCELAHRCADLTRPSRCCGACNHA